MTIPKNERFFKHIIAYLKIQIMLCFLESKNADAILPRNGQHAAKDTSQIYIEIG